MTEHLERGKLVSAFMQDMWKAMCCCCAAVSALLLSSCAGDMCVQVCAPAAAGGVLPRGAKVHVQKHGNGRGALALQRAFAARLQRGGYTMGRSASGAYVLSLENVELTCEHIGSTAPIITDPEKRRVYYERHFERVHHQPSHAVLRATVVLRKDGRTLFSKKHRAFSVNSLHAKPNVNDVCAAFIAGLMKELDSPQSSCCTLPVTPNPSVPEIELAVRACRAGDHARALELARAAHSRHPELAEPVYLVGIMAWLHGDAGAAAVLFRRAYKLQPDTRYLKAAAQATAR